MISLSKIKYKSRMTALELKIIMNLKWHIYCASAVYKSNRDLDVSVLVEAESWRARKKKTYGARSATRNKPNEQMTQYLNPGKQEWPNLRTLTSYQRGQGSIPGPSVMCGLTLLLVLVRAPRVCLPVLRFIPPQKPTLQVLTSLAPFLRA